jgi:hypothetical protein
MNEKKGLPGDASSGKEGSGLNSHPRLLENELMTNWSQDKTEKKDLRRLLHRSVGPS